MWISLFEVKVFNEEVERYNQNVSVLEVGIVIQMAICGAFGMYSPSAGSVEIHIEYFGSRYRAP